LKDRNHNTQVQEFATMTVIRSAPLVGLSLLLAASSQAQAGPRRNAPSLPEPAAQAAPATEGSAAEAPVEAGDGEDSLDERVRRLEEQIARMREEQAQRDAEQSVQSPFTFHGYVDFGFFVPVGNNGVGWIRDNDNQQFPEYEDYAWTFLGDILGTTVNSRGEAADLGEGPGIDRFDSVDSDGAPSFLVNEVNLRLEYALTPNAIARTSINVMPRSAKQDFALGDFLELDIAELEYVLPGDGNTSIFAGKMLPVFGIEYKDRKSHQRFGITPSLISRYTTGPQLGLKARSRLLHDWLILAGSVTNNSSTVEQFDFYREVDRNVGKTLNGRVAISAPVDGLIRRLVGDRLELGFSGEWGAQDKDTRSDGPMWFLGGDLQYLGTNFWLKGQVMWGESPGNEAERVWALKLHPSGYLEADWQALSFLGLLVRGELRDARVTLGTERIYLTKQMRFTGGLRATFNPHIVLKAEYLHNREFGGIDQFKNDMFTSALVLIY
jgi:hypothetical protein